MHRLIPSRLLFRVRVAGESMWPRLTPGKTYWASALIRPKVGRMVVFRDRNSNDYILKEVKKSAGSQLILGGTVSWSKDYVVSQVDILGAILEF